MNFLLGISVLYSFVILGVVVFYYPFTMGKRMVIVNTSGRYFFMLTQAIAMILLSGRVLKRW